MPSGNWLPKKSPASRWSRGEGPSGSINRHVKRPNQKPHKDADNCGYLYEEAQRADFAGFILGKLEDQDYADGDDDCE